MFRYANQKALVSALLSVGAICAAVSLWRDSAQLGGIHWNSVATWWGIAGAGGVPAAIILFLFEKWAWRWPVVRLVMKVPCIEGTWVGTEISDTFPLGREGQSPENRSVVVKIEQSPTSINYVAHNGPTINRGIASEFVEMDDSRTYSLFVIYRNDRSGREEPSKHTRNHNGTCRLDLSRNTADRKSWVLDGHYWTDKLRDGNNPYSGGTTGRIKLKLHGDKPNLCPPAELSRRVEEGM